MATVLYSFAAFVVALGVLITVHEFGHFWVARRAGVKVTRFSIGFGRPLLRWQRDETEYVISMLPLGGYVKMLDAREGPVPVAEQGREFTHKPLAARAAIVAAGPAFNFLFALLAYWLIFTVGITGTRPVVGSVVADSLADRAGLQAGDLLTRVEGEEVQTWEQALSQLMLEALTNDEVELQVREREEGGSRSIVLATQGLQQLGPAEFNTALGLKPLLPKLAAVIGEVVADSAAERGGLQAGDHVRDIDGVAVADWQEAVALVRDHPGRPLQVGVERNGGYLTIAVTPESREVEGKAIGFLGIAPEPPTEGLLQPYLAREHYGPVAAFSRSIAKIGEMTSMSLTMLWRMVIGEASLENLSGPITIAEYAGKTASIGLIEFVNFMALISISLGVINLLPIPLLDGGHLLYYLIEFIKGSPVSAEVEVLGQRIGIAFLLALMSVAFFNDIARLIN